MENNKRTWIWKVLLTFFVGVSVTTWAQHNDSVYVNPDTRPVFGSGVTSIQSFIRTNVEYPEESLKNCEQGKVYLSFVVEVDGNTSNIEVVRGISELLDQEAIRVISLMNGWTPAMNNGKAVRSVYKMPISFSIDKGCRGNKRR